MLCILHCLSLLFSPSILPPASGVTAPSTGRQFFTHPCPGSIGSTPGLRSLFNLGDCRLGSVLQHCPRRAGALQFFQVLRYTLKVITHPPKRHYFTPLFLLLASIRCASAKPYRKAVRIASHLAFGSPLDHFSFNCIHSLYLISYGAGIFPSIDFAIFHISLCIIYLPFL